MAADTGHGSNMSAADMQEHVRTWKGFVTFIKWMLIGNIALLIFLAIFRTHG